MKDQDARGWYVYRTLKQTAETQGPLKAVLDAQGVSYKSFWVANEIVVHQGSRALVDTLAGRRRRQDDRGERLLELARVDLGRRVRLDGDPQGRSPGHGRARPRAGSRAATLGARLHRPGHRRRRTRTRACAGRTTRSSRTTVAGTGRTPTTTTTGTTRSTPTSTATARTRAASTPMAPCDDHRPRHAHDGHGRWRRRRGQPDRRRSRREVDRLPQHGRGHRQARDVHGVLPVLHRADRPEQPERRSDEAAARDEQQLGLPDERALRAGQPADDRGEHDRRRHLRRGLGREQRAGLLERHRPAGDLRRVVLDRRP